MVRDSDNQLVCVGFQRHILASIPVRASKVWQPEGTGLCRGA